MKTDSNQSSNLPMIADTHMLIGEDRSGKIGSIDDYMKRTKGKYKVVGAMSIVSPGYERKNGIFFPCVWKETPKGIISESILQKNDGTKIYRETPDNPYKEANQITRRKLVEAVSKYPKTQFLYYPLLHLTRDNLEFLEEVLSSNRVVKIHGIGSALGPEDIPEDVGRLMKKYGNIILVHTDYFDGKPETALQELQKRNDPAKWMDFFEIYSLKGMFAHGARLCKDTIGRVKKNNNQFIVEAGPIINSQGPRIKTRTDNYVEKLINMVGTDSLVFNTDYPFANEEENLEKELRKNLSDGEYNKVMYENAKRFLRFDDYKYLKRSKIK